MNRHRIAPPVCAGQTLVHANSEGVPRPRLPTPSDNSEGVPTPRRPATSDSSRANQAAEAQPVSPLNPIELSKEDQEQLEKELGLDSEDDDHAGASSSRQKSQERDVEQEVIGKTTRQMQNEENYSMVKKMSTSETPQNRCVEERRGGRTPTMQTDAS